MTDLINEQNTIKTKTRKDILLDKFAHYTTDELLAITYHPDHSQMKEKNLDKFQQENQINQGNNSIKIVGNQELNQEELEGLTKLFATLGSDVTFSENDFNSVYCEDPCEVCHKNCHYLSPIQEKWRCEECYQQCLQNNPPGDDYKIIDFHHEIHRAYIVGTSMTLQNSQNSEEEITIQIPFIPISLYVCMHDLMLLYFLPQNDSKENTLKDFNGDEASYLKDCNSNLIGMNSAYNMFSFISQITTINSTCYTFYHRDQILKSSSPNFNFIPSFLN